MTDAATEGRHPPGPAPEWEESWAFCFGGPDGPGGLVRVTLRPHERVAWYWAALLEPDGGPVLVRATGLAPPRGRTLEVRGDGVWADTICETPGEHWSLGLEAFGVRLDTPGEAYRGERGERMPLGLALDWERSGPPVRLADGYLQPGRTRGEVLRGPERIALDVPALRAHRWGARRWGSRPEHRAVVLGDGGGLVLVDATADPPRARVVARGASDGPETTVVSELSVDDDGVPGRAHHDLGGLGPLDLEASGAVALRVEVPGRPAAHAAYVRGRVHGARSGVAWTTRVEPGPGGRLS